MGSKALAPRTEPLDERVFVIHDFLDEVECQHWLTRADQVGFSAAPVTTADGPVMRPDIRNNERVMFDDDAGTTEVWKRLEPCLPESWTTPRIKCRATSGDFEAIGLNERLRFYRYTEGQQFQPHRDGYYRRSEDELSLLTLLVYLDEGCAGGETHVMARSGAITITPAVGLALLFQHDLLHEGAPVTAGVKHVLRSDVMYRRIAAAP